MADLALHWRVAKPISIRAISINGANWTCIDTDRDTLTIYTETPEQAQDIADGFRKAFAHREDKT